MKTIKVIKFKFGDCTNGGISGKNDILQVIETGDRLPENTENLLKFVTRQLSFGEYTHLEPFNRPINLGWMFGGNTAIIDGIEYKIHDRQETQKQYNDLSK